MYLLMHSMLQATRLARGSCALLGIILIVEPHYYYYYFGQNLYLCVGTVWLTPTPLIHLSQLLYLLFYLFKLEL